MNKNILSEFETVEGRKLLNQERLLVEATERIAICMEERQLTRADLARRMGVSAARVTQILRADKNLTLRSLADVFHAMGVEVSIAPKKSQWLLRSMPSDGDMPASPPSLLAG